MTPVRALHLCEVADPARALRRRVLADEGVRHPMGLRADQAASVRGRCRRRAPERHDRRRRLPRWSGRRGRSASVIEVAAAMYDAGSGRTAHAAVEVLVRARWPGSRGARRRPDGGRDPRSTGHGRRRRRHPLLQVDEAGRERGRAGPLGDRRPAAARGGRASRACTTSCSPPARRRVRTAVALGHRIRADLRTSRTADRDPERFVEVMLDTVYTKWSLPNTKTTVLQDWIKGRHSEVEEINGLVVQEQYRLGGACPANQVTVDVARRIESGELDALTGQRQAPGRCPRLTNTRVNRTGCPDSETEPGHPGEGSLSRWRLREPVWFRRCGTTCFRSCASRRPSSSTCRGRRRA